MKKAFTLIEVIVSLALIAIVTTLVISLIIISSRVSDNESDKRNAWRIVHNIHQEYLFKPQNFENGDLLDHIIEYTDEENSKYTIELQVINNGKFLHLKIIKIKSNNKEILSNIDLGKVNI
jgi:prepilin-type N-terminal cleavage/methylation domain-containing protein